MWFEVEKGCGVMFVVYFDIFFGVVLQWKDNGVLLWYMKVVCDFIGGEVSFEEMVLEFIEVKVV